MRISLLAATKPQKKKTEISVMSADIFGCGFAMLRWFVCRRCKKASVGALAVFNVRRVTVYSVTNLVKMHDHSHCFSKQSLKFVTIQKKSLTFL